MVSRRGFVRTTFTALGAVLGSATAASALMLESEPPASLNALYEAAKAACGGAADAYHRQLLADAEALLADREASEDERQRVLASVSCPLCGCAVGRS